MADLGDISQIYHCYPLVSTAMLGAADLTSCLALPIMITARLSLSHKTRFSRTRTVTEFLLYRKFSKSAFDPYCQKV